MPAYNSSYNDEKATEACGMLILPLKTSIKGPAPKKADSGEDIIDETIKLYRANVLFASFQVKGGADRVLIFLTLFISQCLKRLTKSTNKAAAEKEMFKLAKEKFPMPGESGWLLGGHIPRAKSRKEEDNARKYMEQLREETSQRIVEIVFASGKPNKYWMAFSKRKFMNLNVK